MLFEPPFAAADAVRPLAEGDMGLLLAFFSRHGDFLALEGDGKADAARILADMHALPPGRRKEEKHYCGFFKGETLLAVADTVENHPQQGTAYIGLFAVEKRCCGKGIGTALMEELFLRLRREGFCAVRLGVYRENAAAARFWKKLGFLPAGEKAIAGKTVDVLEKAL